MTKEVNSFQEPMNSLSSLKKQKMYVPTNKKQQQTLNPMKTRRNYLITAYCFLSSFPFLSFPFSSSSPDLSSYDGSIFTPRYKGKNWKTYSHDALCLTSFSLNQPLLRSAFECATRREKKKASPPARTSIWPMERDSFFFGFVLVLPLTMLARLSCPFVGLDSFFGACLFLHSHYQEYHESLFLFLCHFIISTSSNK